MKIREQIEQEQSELDLTTMPTHIRHRRQRFIDTMKAMLEVVEAVKDLHPQLYPIGEEAEIADEKLKDSLAKLEDKL